MTATALVHLVRLVNGFDTFERFITSYERRGSGAEHDLVLLFKGSVGDPQLRSACLERAADHAPVVLDVSDEGYDLTAYLAAAARLEHRRLCFVNSFSEILADGWLGLLDAAAAERGIAGATASYGSHLGFELFLLGLPGPYASAFSSRRQAIDGMYSMSETPMPDPIRLWLYSLYMALRRMRTMGRFPSPHMRTNAFVIERELLLGLRTGRMQTKQHAYVLESGRSSITAQLRALGRSPGLVDRAGVVRSVPEWHAADVFAQRGQEQLLVADNQTRAYAEATPEQRRVVSAFAWGPHSRPPVAAES